MDFIMSHIYREYIITQLPEREERWQYPLPAIREFIINAIIHRDYRKGIHSQFKVFRDKIELWNIGKLPEELTIEDLYKGNEKSLPRNIKIADIFKEAFLIEKYGSGIKRAVKELNDYHLPLPMISEIAGGVNVIITANRDTIKDTLKDTIKDTIKDTLINGEKETIIMQKIREKPTVTADELSKILNINLRNTKKYLTQLKEQGKIMRMGSRKTGYWQVI
jgi:ATP-dependent DNA helicase RecG